MTATETWNKVIPGFFSPITSCIYQDGNSYLLNYSAFGQNAALTQPIGSVLTVIFGMDSSYNFAFEYAFPGGYTTSWNTIPIHLESVVYQ